MKDTINQWRQGSWGAYEQGLGTLKRSAGILFANRDLEYEGRRQELAGMVRRNGGLTREEALLAVGNFSAPSHLEADLNDDQETPAAGTAASKGHFDRELLRRRRRIAHSHRH